MGKLHLFELRSGHILLDGVTIRGIRECEFSIKENDSLAELSLKMDGCHRADGWKDSGRDGEEKGV